MRKYFILIGFMALNAAIPSNQQKLKYNEFLTAMTHNSTSLKKPYYTSDDPLYSKITDLNNKINNLTDRLGLKSKAQDLIQPLDSLVAGNPVGDQNNDVATQLKDGIRGFKVPLHVDDQGEVRICHTLSKDQMANLVNPIQNKVDNTFNRLPSFLQKILSNLKNKLDGIASDFKNNPCIVDRTNQSLESFLAEINNYLESNPQEIITIYFDTFAIDLGATKDKLKNILDEAGISGKIYYSEQAEWPTLAEMISSNKRVVMFGAKDGWEELGIYNKNNIGVGSDYDYKTISDLNNNTNNPSIYWGAKGPNRILMIDNYTTPVLAGSSEDAPTVNEYNSVKARVEAYQKLTESPATVIMVDFYQVPNNDVVKFVNDWNETNAAKK